MDYYKYIPEEEARKVNAFNQILKVDKVEANTNLSRRFIMKFYLTYSSY